MFVESVLANESSNVVIAPLLPLEDDSDKNHFSLMQRFSILHNLIQGRIRFSIPELKRNIPLKKFIEYELIQYEGIYSVNISSVTGSLLIYFEPEILIEYALCKLLNIILDNFQPNLEGFPKIPSIRSQVTKQELPWHHMSQDEVLAYWDVNVETGLETESLQARFEQFGYNTLQREQARSPWDIFQDQFKNLPVALLLGSAVVSFATAAAFEGGVILSLIGVNALIGYRTEMSAQHTVSLLEKTKLTSIRVRRNRKLVDLVSEELLPGDVFYLKEGMYVPADARLLESHHLTVDESALTGESLPVLKSAESLNIHVALADRHNMVYRGTFVTAGKGWGLVVGTGLNTQIGFIQNLVDSTENSETPLQKQTHRLGNQIALGSFGVGAGMLGLCFLRKVGWLETCKLSLAMIVAAIPEGLPMLVTLSLERSARMMRKDKVLVRNLDAIETLGSAQILCFDKTGTLTQNKMSVISLFVDREILDWPTHEEKASVSERSLSCLMELAVLCNDTKLSEEEGKVILIGSPTEKALIEMALDFSIDVKALRDLCPLKSVQYRTEQHSYMKTVHNREGKFYEAIKGSPEQVLELCSYLLHRGKILKLTSLEKKQILEANENMGALALRVLGLAYVQEGRVVWVGLVGMRDKERKGTRELVHSLHHAGIKPIMITGDQAATARALGYSLGFMKEGECLEVCDFAQCRHFKDEELEEQARKAHVFARVTPADKLRIVQILKAQGKIVAMIGDGINDTPALKASHIGVAMGKKGADVARDIANMVILDDNLNSLLPAIEKGREGYDSIKKSVLFLLSTNLSEILLMFGATAFGMGQALHPLQILWINLVSDLFPALALAFDPSDKKVLAQGPLDGEAPLMSRSDFKRIGSEAGMMAGLALTAYGAGIAFYGRGTKAQTMAFLTLTSSQLLHTFSSRSEDHSIFSKAKLQNNPYIGASVFLGWVLQGLPFVSGRVRQLFGLSPMALKDIGICGALALSNYLWNELSRMRASDRRLLNDQVE